MENTKLKVKSLLGELDIEPQFITSELQELYDKSINAESGGAYGVVNHVVVKYEAVLEALSEIKPEINSEELIKRYTGKSHLPQKVNILEFTQLRNHVAEKLAELTGLDFLDVKGEFKNYKKSILSVPLGRQEFSWNWERSFVLFLAEKLKGKVKVTAKAEIKLEDDDWIGSPEDQLKNIQKINVYIQFLAEKFSTRNLQSVYQSWQPSSGLANKLEGEGVTREEIYNRPFINSFVNKCQRERVLLTQVEFEYTKYMLAHRVVVSGLSKRN